MVPLQEFKDFPVPYLLANSAFFTTWDGFFAMWSHWLPPDVVVNTLSATATVSSCFCSMKKMKSLIWPKNILSWLLMLLLPLILCVGKMLTPSALCSLFQCSPCVIFTTLEKILCVVSSKIINLYVSSYNISIYIKIWSVGLNRVLRCPVLADTSWSGKLSGAGSVLHARMLRKWNERVKQALMMEI